MSNNRNNLDSSTSSASSSSNNTTASTSNFIFNDIGDTNETLNDAINSTPVLSLVNSNDGLNDQHLPPVIDVIVKNTINNVDKNTEELYNEEQEEVEEVEEDSTSTTTTFSASPSSISSPSILNEDEDEIVEVEEKIPPIITDNVESLKQEQQQQQRQQQQQDVDISNNNNNNNDENPFQLDNRKSREIYKTKILEKQRSLDSIPPVSYDYDYPSSKQIIILRDKRHTFIKKLVNRVFSTLKSATSDDLLSSQKNRILKELFRNLSSELDDSVLEYLQCDEFKQGSPIKGTVVNQKDQFASFSPLKLSETVHNTNTNTPKIQIPPSLTLLNEHSNSPMDVRHHKEDPINLNIEKKSYTYDYPILDDKEQPTIYYYQLVSLYLNHIPNEVDKNRHLFLTLYNNHWFFLIFSSLFYLWLLEYRLSLIPQVNVFIKATNRLFWHDNDYNSQRFKEVYMVIKNKLLDGSLWKGLNEANNDVDSNNDPHGILQRNRRLWVDFYHIITVFFFYYEDNITKESLDSFRQVLELQYNQSIVGNDDPTLSELSIDDIFVRGIIRHLYQIKSEEILIKYIECCTYFKDWNLTAVTKIKLQSCLYSFSKPGSPAHMPRDVRVTSRKVLDILFPQGSLSRHTVNLFFRLLHPYYSTGSIVHWMKETIKQYLPSFLTKKQ